MLPGAGVVAAAALEVLDDAALVLELELECEVELELVERQATS